MRKPALAIKRQGSQTWDFEDFHGKFPAAPLRSHGFSSELLQKVADPPDVTTSSHGIACSRQPTSRTQRKNNDSYGTHDNAPHGVPTTSPVEQGVVGILVRVVSTRFYIVVCSLLTARVNSKRCYASCNLLEPNAGRLPGCEEWGAACSTIEGSHAHAQTTTRHTGAGARTHAATHTHTHSHTHTHTHTQPHTHSRTATQPHSHTATHSHTDTQTHTRADTRSQGTHTTQCADTHKPRT